ncbi:MAG: hypothetical protein ACC662_05740 [Planctomycetota bacterium]
MGLGRYVKAAFLNQWNLLVVIGASIFGLLTGRPDVVLPIVAAGEIAYLGLLGTHPRFQRAVDAREAKEKRAKGALTSKQALDRILAALPPASLARYEGLRGRARDLRQIALDLQAPTSAATPPPFEKLQLRGLDRLLWIFLRLLYTEHALSLFLERTDERTIQADIRRLESDLGRYPAGAKNPRRAKARKTIQDNLETSRARLENLGKARENHELVVLELDRLENKIRSLAELAVNRQEPEFITDQVDSVADSMLETERTMSDLKIATGLLDVETDEDVPHLLSEPVVEQ